LRDQFLSLRDHLAAGQLGGEFATAVYLIVTQLSGRGRPVLVPSQILECVRRLQSAEAHSLLIIAGAERQFYAALLAGDEGPFALVMKIAGIKARETRLVDRFRTAPKMDYIGAKARIESLNTQSLAERIDESFIDFYNNQKNDAMAFGKIIREKQRFPVDKFAQIKSAFPCVIAGLRDYAEFIPLENGLFDLVIIDEASQVSIAQALPNDYEGQESARAR
jgi:hypothetical protein